LRGAGRGPYKNSQHPDRNAQFQYINHKVQDFLGRGLPKLSVDAKKKETVGKFKYRRQVFTFFAKHLRRYFLCGVVCFHAQ
jgi:hypothetical protein